MFIGGFQSRRGVHGIAVCSVVEELLATEVSDNGDTGVYPEPRNAKWNAFMTTKLLMDDLPPDTTENTDRNCSLSVRHHRFTSH